MSNELENICGHLEMYEHRTDRPLHMDVLHLCSDYRSRGEEMAAMHTKLCTERREADQLRAELEASKKYHSELSHASGAVISDLKAELEAERRKSVDIIRQFGWLLRPRGDGDGWSLVDPSGLVCASGGINHCINMIGVSAREFEQKKQAALRQCVEALEKCKGALPTDWIPDGANEAITAAKEVLK